MLVGKEPLLFLCDPSNSALAVQPYLSQKAPLYPFFFSFFFFNKKQGHMQLFLHILQRKKKTLRLISSANPGLFSHQLSFSGVTKIQAWATGYREHNGI